jgi:sulfur-oxidizing protein SoxX
MRKSSVFLTAVGAVALLAGGLTVGQAAYAGPGAGGEMPNKKVCADASDPVVVGGCVATNRKKGNCMACHNFAGLEKTRVQPGNIAPPLVAMQQRFADKATLRAQVYDPQKANPNTVMPPYGAHGIVSEKELDLIVEWLYTL